MLNIHSSTGDSYGFDIALNHDAYLPVFEYSEGSPLSTAVVKKPSNSLL